MRKLEIIQDENGNKVVLIPDIIFVNKQNIDWNKVEIYLGKAFPDEYTGSKYTRKTKGGIAKAKANAVQGIREMIEIAINKAFRENHKKRHIVDAKNGWYYYITRFALPIYDNELKTDMYNFYTGCLVVNCTSRGRMYLYDLVDIKKEASNPLKTTK